MHCYTRLSLVQRCKSSSVLWRIRGLGHQEHPRRRRGVRRQAGKMPLSVSPTPHLNAVLVVCGGDWGVWSGWSSPGSGIGVTCPRHHQRPAQTARPPRGTRTHFQSDCLLEVATVEPPPVLCRVQSPGARFGRLERACGVRPRSAGGPPGCCTGGQEPPPTTFTARLAGSGQREGGGGLKLHVNGCCGTRHKLLSNSSARCTPRRWDSTQSYEPQSLNPSSLPTLYHPPTPPLGPPLHPAPHPAPPPPSLCDIRGFFTGPRTVTRSSLRMLRRGNAF